MTGNIPVGARVRLLDRSARVVGTVLAVSPWRERSVQVELKLGRADATFWFAPAELQVVLESPDSRTDR